MFSPRTSLPDKKKSLTDQKSAIKAQTDDTSLTHQVIDQETQTNVGLNVKPKVQDDFRNLLLEFVINCLLDQPSDVINYAAGYFVELQERQHTVMVHDYDHQPVPTVESVVSTPDMTVSAGAITDLDFDQ